MTLDEYRNKSLHLPPEFRDFHDQKDIFKLIGPMKDLGTNKDIVNWQDGMCYTIDMFLWIMAKYGFELRKTRRKVVRENLSLAIERRKREEGEAFKKMLEERKISNA